MTQKEFEICEQEKGFAFIKGLVLGSVFASIVMIIIYHLIEKGL